MKFYKSENYFDDRGAIMNALPDNPVVRNVMFITGVEGAVRGQHKHKEDSHYTMVTRGLIQFEWIDQEGKHQSMLLGKGDVVFSEPGEAHKFTFITSGEFIAMSTEPRTPEKYEKDLERIEF